MAINETVIRQNVSTLVEMIIKEEETEKFVSLFFAKVEDKEKLLRIAKCIASSKKRYRQERTFNNRFKVSVWEDVMNGFLGLKDSKKKSITKPKTKAKKSELAKTLFG